MGLGLELGKGKYISSGRYKVVFGGVKEAEAVSGLTYLAHAFLFFLFSTYNPKTKTGSRLRDRLKDGILYTKSADITAIEIQDDIQDAEARFKAFQAEAVNLTPEQTLKEVRILNIDINRTTGVITVDINIYNILDQKAGVRV